MLFYLFFEYFIVKYLKFILSIHLCSFCAKIYKVSKMHQRDSKMFRFLTSEYLNRSFLCTLVLDKCLFQNKLLYLSDLVKQLIQGY